MINYNLFMQLTDEQKKYYLFNLKFCKVKLSLKDILLRESSQEAESFLKSTIYWEDTKFPEQDNIFYWSELSQRLARISIEYLVFSEHFKYCETESDIQLMYDFHPEFDGSIPWWEWLENRYLKLSEPIKFDFL